MKLVKIFDGLIKEESYKISKGNKCTTSNLSESKKYEMFRNGSNMEFRKKSNNGLIGSVQLNDRGQLPDRGYLKLAAGPSKEFNNKLELHDLINGLVSEHQIKEESYKISKGNKSTKNSFGDTKVETPWATGDREKCCSDYGIQYEAAEKKLDACKSIEKLDEEYTNLFLQMDNSFDRNNLRLCYYEKRRDLTKWAPPKNDSFTSNILK